MPRLPRTAAAVAGAVLVATAVSVPAAAVTGGAADGDRHPSVAMVLNSAGRQMCTGVYVNAPPGQAVVLTDAHCLYAARHLSGRVSVAFASSWTPSTRSLPGTFYVHPDYDPQTSAHDLAVIDLDHDPAITPAALAPLGSGDSVSTVDVVGTGQPHAGQRRSATELVTSSSPAWLFLKAGTGNTCGGDSGGPDFLPGTTQVVALTDLGSCSVDQDTRVDTPDAQAFIADAATWDVSPPQVSAALSAGSAVPGDSILLAGVTNKVFAGDRMLAQTKSNGTWSTVGAVTVGRNGAFSYRLEPAAPGVYEHRFYLPRTSSHLRSVSVSAELHVAVVAATGPLRNGDLEGQSLAPWRTTGTVRLTGTAHAGAAAMQVGSTAPVVGDSVASESFLAAQDGTVSLHYEVRCADTVRYDWVTATLSDDANGTTTSLLPRTCRADRQWNDVSAPLTAGHSYTLVLTVHDDGARGDPTYALFDDVEVSASS